MQEPLTSRPEGHQLSFLCACGKRPIELKTLGCCRRCYDRRHHSLRFFSGMRERVLERDDFRCRACGAESPLLVHHLELTRSRRRCWGEGKRTMRDQEND
jgi:hypothetical protein